MRISKENLDLKQILPQFLQSGSLIGLGDGFLWMGWGEPSRLSRPSLDTLSFQVYAPDFFLKDSLPWWQFPFSIKVHQSELLAELDRFYPEEVSTAPLEWVSSTIEEFFSLFEQIQHKIKENVFEKIVPVIFETAVTQSEAKERRILLKNLIQSSMSLPLFLYGVWNEEEGILGATPEILFQYSPGKALSTVAVAGTRLNATSALPLGEDPKQLREHQLVIDGIKQSLSGLGKIEVKATQEIFFQKLSHLMTPIFLNPTTKTGKEEFFSEVVRCLHPTPALGAFPKEAGMSWLESQQKIQDRHRFGAPFGGMWHGTENLCLVGIRNLQFKRRGQLTEWKMGAGCGVIAESDAHTEWRELQGKIQMIKDLFKISEVVGV